MLFLQMAQFSTATFQLHKATAFHCLISIRLSTYIQIIIRCQQINIINFCIYIQAQIPMLESAITLTAKLMIGDDFRDDGIYEDKSLAIKIVCIQLMKRRTNKKTSSFDLIKIEPKAKQEKQDFTNQTDSPIRQPFYPHDYRRDRKYLQLPKIHSYHVYSVNNETNRIRNHVDSKESPKKQKKKLQLLGVQYHKDDIILQNSKEAYLNLEKKLSQKNQQKNQAIEIFNKKLSINNESTTKRLLFSNTILSSLKIQEVVFERKKISVYIQDGNNSRMVKQIFRKRPQLVFVNDKKDANIVWTRFCDYQSSKHTTKFIEEQLPTLDIAEDESNTLNSSQDLKKKQLIKSQSIVISQGGQNGSPLRKFHCKPNLLFQLELEETELSQNTSKTKLIIQDLHYHNHFMNHHELSDKKSLFANLKKYCQTHQLDLSRIVPPTYQISYNQILNEGNFLPTEIIDEELWIVKPGQDTNRGDGITVVNSRKGVQQQVKKLLNTGRTALLQKYIEPLLYKNRKIDIRCYSLVICIRGELKAYWYKQGYIRTCSKQFTTDPKDIYAHLTNDAIQKKSPLYGKYEQSNKLSFSEIESYMRSKELNFREASENMKLLAYYSIKSAEDKLRNEKKLFSFEIFGYDFLIDRKGKVWLIQVNTNPCLEFTGSLTSRIIWHMVDNSLKICLDPFLQQFQFDNMKQETKRIFEDNRYECII